MENNPPLPSFIEDILRIFQNERHEVYDGIAMEDLCGWYFVSFI